MILNLTTFTTYQKNYFKYKYTNFHFQYMITAEKRCDVFILPEKLYPAGLGIAVQPDSIYTGIFSQA